MAPQLVAFRPGELKSELQCRTDPDESLSSVAHRDLSRYYYLLRDALTRQRFTEQEASLLCEALNGSMVEPHSASLLWAEIDDAITMDDLAGKWGVDGVALVARLRALTPFEALAVEDAVERWWKGPFQHDDRITALRQVGLVR